MAFYISKVKQYLPQIIKYRQIKQNLNITEPYIMMNIFQIFKKF